MFNLDLSAPLPNNMPTTASWIYGSTDGSSEGLQSQSARLTTLDRPSIRPIPHTDDALSFAQEVGVHDRIAVVGVDELAGSALPKEWLLNG
ncbi:MAG: hypothetical protein AAGC91_09010 [Pseudomonadota bacterium]